MGLLSSLSSLNASCLKIRFSITRRKTLIPITIQGEVLCQTLNLILTHKSEI